MTGRGKAGHRFDKACYSLADLIPSGHLLAGTDPAGFIETVATTVEHLQKRVGEQAQLLRNKAESDEIKVPFWLWEALLRRISIDGCEHEEGCGHSDQCVTEWCLPCAATAFYKTTIGDIPCPDEGEFGEDEEGYVR